MTWVKLDDRWTDESIIVGLSYPTRWHYLSMVTVCCRMANYDGILRRVDARRASDVDEPDDAIAELLDVGLVVPVEGGFQLTQIARHVLPPHLRDENRKASGRERTKKWREKKPQGSDGPSDASPGPSSDASHRGRVGVGSGSGLDGGSSSRDAETEVVWPQPVTVPVPLTPPALAAAPPDVRAIAEAVVQHLPQEFRADLDHTALVAAAHHAHDLGWLAEDVAISARWRDWRRAEDSDPTAWLASLPAASGRPA